MENPRLINRSFYGVFVGIFLLSVLDAILTHDSQPMLWGLSVPILFVLFCGVAALVNLAIFPPVFQLLARLTGTPKAKCSVSKGDDASC